MIAAYAKEKTVQKVQFAGNIANKQTELEAIEQVKEEIQKSNEENRSKKLLKTCEHGQMLMTINNIYSRCHKHFQGCYMITKEPIIPPDYDIEKPENDLINQFTFK